VLWKDREKKWDGNRFVSYSVTYLVSVQFNFVHATSNMPTVSFICRGIYCAHAFASDGFRREPLPGRHRWRTRMSDMLRCSGRSRSGRIVHVFEHMFESNRYTYLWRFILPPSNLDSYFAHCFAKYLSDSGKKKRYTLDISIGRNKIKKRAYTFV